MTFDEYAEAVKGRAFPELRMKREDWTPCEHCGVMPSQWHKKSCPIHGYHKFWSSLVVKHDKARAPA